MDIDYARCGRSISDNPVLDVISRLSFSQKRMVMHMVTWILGCIPSLDGRLGNREGPCLRLVSWDIYDKVKLVVHLAVSQLRGPILVKVGIV